MCISNNIFFSWFQICAICAVKLILRGLALMAVITDMPMILLLNQLQNV